MASLHQGPGEVGAGERALAAAGSLIRGLETGKADALERFVVAICPGHCQTPTELRKRRRHLLRKIDQEVLLGVFVDGGQLDSMHNPDVAPRHAVPPPRKRRGHVVVGQRDDIEPMLGTPTEDLVWRQPAIRAGGVHVQIQPKIARRSVAGAASPHRTAATGAS